MIRAIAGNVYAWHRGTNHAVLLGDKVAIFVEFEDAFKRFRVGDVPNGNKNTLAGNFPRVVGFKVPDVNSVCLAVFTG